MRYSEIDHEHCWKEDNPPCGQKIEHLVCCLCGKPNPKIKTLEKDREIYRITKQHSQMINKTMKTPRIDEMVEEFERQMPLMRAHGKLLCATASPSTYKKIKDWLRQALTQAHQAGIDEAVEVAKAHYYTVNVDKQPTIQDEAWANQYDSKAEAFWYGEAKGLEALDDTIKALQDNK